MFLFSRIKLRIILLLEKVMYVLRRTTPNTLNLILLVALRLSLSQLYHHSSSTSFSYTASLLNSMYTPLTLFFDSNISESRVSGINNKVSACVDKVVSKLQLLTQFIQTQSNQSSTQKFYPHIRPIQSISTLLQYSTQFITTPSKQLTHFIKTLLKKSNTHQFFLLHHYLILSVVSQVLISRIIIYFTQPLIIGSNQSLLYYSHS